MRKFHLGAFSGAKDHYHDNEIGICAMAGTAFVNAFFSAPLFFCVTLFTKKTKSLNTIILVRNTAFSDCK